MTGGAWVVVALAAIVTIGAIGAALWVAIKRRRPQQGEAALKATQGDVAAATADIEQETAAELAELQRQKDKLEVIKKIPDEQKRLQALADLANGQGARK